MKGRVGDGYAGRQSPQQRWRTLVELRWGVDYAAEVAQYGFALSNREREVLMCASVGMGNAQIADHIGTAPDTVKTLFRRVSVKLEAGNRTHAVAVAIRRGFIR